MKSIVDYTNKLKDFFASKQALTNVESDIAPIEDGTNYSTSYTKGAQFIRGGLLYRVTASSVNSSTAIDTSSGGNATRADSVTKQLKETMSNPLSNMVSLITKTGDVKFLELIQPNSAMTYNVSYNCGTLPAEYRPSASYTNCHFYANSREYAITVNNNGSVSLTCLSDTLPSGGQPLLYYVFTFI